MPQTVRNSKASIDTGYLRKFVCIHGHFYQPPRENPWLEQVELQDSAYPYHDWNERIAAECYAPNASARILDADKAIIDIVSNYEYMSFNFGPTLLSWMERHRQQVYDAIIEADYKSRDRFNGHGSALAQVYNHVIMPLSSDRDKRTQVEWGIKDFLYRFGREPEGMWLAETAVDTSTLEILAEYGITFTILSPYQARRVRALKSGRGGASESDRWIDAAGGRVDPRRPYLCRLPSGRSISLFFYDGPVSQEIAFGGLLRSGELFSSRLLGLFSESPSEPQLVNIATDGETYGHHHRNGEMALSYCIHQINSRSDARLSIYGAFLEIAPPEWEVEIIENSSWSCPHGVERWRSDCGCRLNHAAGWNQGWRGPLRTALNWLRSEVDARFEESLDRYVEDPWAVRNAYGAVVINRTPETIREFLQEQVKAGLSQDDSILVLKALETQRNGMLMYTSCGWFFDEISGIETVQVLQYAARVIQLSLDLQGRNLEPLFMRKLRSAVSNRPEFRHGARVYEKEVKPARVDLPRVASHYAVTSLFDEYSDHERVECFRVDREQYERFEAGKNRLAIGRVTVSSLVTLEHQQLAFAVLHLGDQNLMGGVSSVRNDAEFDRMQRRIRDGFRSHNIPGIILLLDEIFGSRSYLIWNLFKDAQRRVLNDLLSLTYQEVEVHYRRIFENNYSVLQAMKEMEIPIPTSLSVPVEYVLNTELRKIFEETGNPRPSQIRSVVQEFSRWPFEPDKNTLGYVIGGRITAMIMEFESDPVAVHLLERLIEVFAEIEPLRLDLDLHEAQNAYFEIGSIVAGDPTPMSDEWYDLFEELGRCLGVRVKNVRPVL